MAKEQKGARNKLRLHFLNNIGRIMDSEELRTVAGISEWARRIRELRDQEGMQILTHNDRAFLKSGQYLLETEKPRSAFKRKISKEVRAFVLDRDGFTCQMCGAVAAEPHPYNKSRKTRLHIGHILDKSYGGSDEAYNLRALCSICNEGASNLTMERPERLKLLTQLRRARNEDQLEALKWLISKFPKQANKVSQQTTE